MRGEFLVVAEGEARLRVNLFDYLDTGLFLDHRPAAPAHRARGAGKRFLNLFCYTGAATVQAAVGGAGRPPASTCRRTYLEWAAQNLALNDVAGARAPPGAGRRDALAGSRTAASTT